MIRTAFLRVFLYFLPLIFWVGLAGLAATELGSYQRSWELLYRFLDGIEPGFPHPDPQVVSMYQVTQATRKLAQVTVYAGLTAFAIRLWQAGRPRLQLQSLVMGVVIPAVFMGLEVYLRLYQAEGTRHVRAPQFLLDLLGIGLVQVGTVLFFAVKDVKRRLLAQSATK